MENKENTENTNNPQVDQQDAQSEAENIQLDPKEVEKVLETTQTKIEENIPKSDEVQEETKPSEPNNTETYEVKQDSKEDDPQTSSAENNENSAPVNKPNKEEKEESSSIPQNDEVVESQENNENEKTEEKEEQKLQEGEAIQKQEEVQEEMAKEEEIIEGAFNYKSVLKEGLAMFEHVLPKEKWNLDNNNNGIQIYSRLDDTTGLKMTRGEGVIFKPAIEIRDVLLDPSATLKWEGSLIANEIVEKNDNYTLLKSLDQKRTLVAQRETLILIKDMVREDGSILVFERSVEHPEHPTKKDCVRAFVHLWACLLTPDKEDENKTAVTFIIFIDPKGWVPKPLFNAVVNGQAMNVQKLKTYIEKL